MLSFAAVPVFAANIFFNAKSQSFAQGEEFLVQVFLNTEGESVNAIEGRVVFPADLLEAREIREGNSSISFWIEKARILQPGVVTFSGITPGGLSGLKEFLFSVVFRSKKEGRGAIQTDALRILRNDGKGTPVIVKVSPLQFSISQKFSPISPMIESIKDTEPPEGFKPTIESDPSIFDGKYFFVFATQDKGSGIDRYEVREGFWGGFHIAESPYLLQSQKLDKKIFVKAVDKNGNERIEILYPPHWYPWYENYWIFGILIIGALAIFYIVRKILWQKSAKSR